MFPKVRPQHVVWEGAGGQCQLAVVYMIWGQKEVTILPLPLCAEGIPQLSRRGIN